MNNRQAYDAWSDSYDAVRNKTRDLEAFALREIFAASLPPDVLEIGCGTGKNTAWLLTRAKKIVAADFSTRMLAQAQAKISSEKVEFKQLDLRQAWDFPAASFDLIVCSLVLEHLANIDFVFSEARRVLRSRAAFYIGELHPFKQYQGAKARFETGSGVFELECFVHHVSDFFAAAKKHGFVCRELAEWFDDGDRTQIPRLLTFVFENRK